MAKIDYSKIFLKEAVPTSIGGQAVMEGIMMQGEESIALAMRLPDDSIYVETDEKKPQPGIMKVPLLRGVVAFFLSLINGMKYLTRSADILEEHLPEDEQEKESKFEAWLNKKFGEKAAWNFLMALAVIFAVVITVIFFIILPTWVVNFLNKYISNSIVLNLIEGILRIFIFIMYILAIRKMEDIHTLFQYHGAEHKTIHCFENGLELTPENADTFYTLHPRCGTSFLVFVLIISILLFSFLGWPNLLWRIVSRLLLMPVVAGVSYELLKWAGRSDNIIVRVLSYPGLMLQKLTTAEPTKAQLEVAIASLKAVLPEDSEEENEETKALDKDADGDAATEEGENERKDDSAEREAFLKRLHDEMKEYEPPDVPDHTIVINNEAAKKRTIGLPGSVGYTLRRAEDALSQIENGKNEAAIILSYITGMSRSDMITKANDKLKNEDIMEYGRLLKERMGGKPLQYITKVQSFMGLPFKVNPSVLIPRLDTEVLADQVLGIIKGKGWKEIEILDLCTGSGALGISLAYNCPEAKVTMTDIDSEAMSTAIGNAQINGVFRRCNFLVGDMFGAIPDNKKYDIIVSNPPYIRSEEIETLAPEVKNHEPRLALDGGRDGLDYYRIIAKEAGSHIESGGILALEIGCDQADEVKALLAETEEYEKIAVIKDLAGLDRVIIAERK